MWVPFARRLPVGLDIDGLAGSELLMEWASGQSIPDTLEFTTPGGGRRLLFQWPAEGIATKSFKVGGKEAIRILGKGTQTVAPPSIHATGGTYKWCSGLSPADIKPAPVPAWLLARMTEETKLGLLKPEDGQVSQPVPTPTPTSSLDRIKAYLAKCDPAIAHQGGHNQTFKVCCRIWDFDPTQDEDTAFALAWNHFNVKCQPPWTEKELRHKLQDAQKQPRRDMGLKKNDQIMMAQWLKEDGFGLSPKEAIDSSFDTIQSKPVEWLWPGWIPLGKLAMLDGDPGLGKSTLLLDIATRVSLGGIMPDCKQGAAGDVLIMSAEDDPADTIKPRLEAAGANLTRIHNMDEIVENGKPRPYMLPDDIPAISSKIKATKAKLLIIDPIMAFISKADPNKDSEIRKVLHRISKMAAKHGCAVIAMRHLNKSNGTKAIYRGNSSIAMIGHARTGLLVAENPDNDKERVLAVSKTNLAKKPKSLRFALEPVGDVCKVGWTGSVNYTADQLLATKTEEEKQESEQKQTKLQQAIDMIELLFNTSPTPGKLYTKPTKAALSAAGIGTSTQGMAIDTFNFTLHMPWEDGEIRPYWTK